MIDSYAPTFAEIFESSRIVAVRFWPSVEGEEKNRKHLPPYSRSVLISSTRLKDGTRKSPQVPCRIFSQREERESRISCDKHSQFTSYLPRWHRKNDEGV